MIEKSLKRVAGVMLSSALAFSVGSADDFIFKTKSLVGIEGGYGTFDVEKSPATTNPTSRHSGGVAGLKIGAEGENFRIFLGVRNYFLGGEYDYFGTAGVELQYMFNFSQYANFFIGGSTGMVNGRFQLSSENFNRKFSDTYYGGDVGFNIHINKTFDLELGARLIATNASDDQAGTTYTIDHITSGYASIIIKYEMD